MKNLKRISIALVGLISVVSLATVSNMYLGGEFDTPAPPQAVTTPVPAPAVTQDPTVGAYMQELGLDYSQLNLIYGVNPAIPAGEASYTYPNTIYLTDRITGNEIYTALSHEYIHYVQNVTDKVAAESFYPYMDELMNSNKWLYDRMSDYRTNKLCTENCLRLQAEVQAVACTELPDTRLRADFAAFCRKHLPNRSNLL